MLWCRSGSGFRPVVLEARLEYQRRLVAAEIVLSGIDVVKISAFIADLFCENVGLTLVSQLKAVRNRNGGRHREGEAMVGHSSIYQVGRALFPHRPAIARMQKPGNRSRNNLKSFGILSTFWI